MADRQFWRYFDWPLFLAVVVLCLIGISMVYSATINTIDLSDYWTRQLIFAVLGLVAMMAISVFDYRHLEMFAPPAFLVFIALLVAVDLFGTAQDTGAQRWISVGGTLVQPTEAGKFLVIIFMAWYLSWYQEYLYRLPYLIVALLLLLAPLILIYRQPNLGMVLTFAFIGGTLILVAGIRFWQVGLLAIGAVGMGFYLQDRLQGYMQERIQMWLYPDQYEAATYNIEQALIAVGSGGWLGQGWGQGSQNQLHFLRVRQSDFIFSVISEELGLVGALIVLTLLFFVMWRLLRIADQARDQFGRLIAVGVTAIIFFQTVVNVGMNLSMVPVTGLTLPFISYGGSSLVSMMFAIGLAQSVRMRHRKIEFQ
ncbi:MAG: FtsW/RodA/SpoVE family cell cycle protein [Chloroflexota bacterium]|nr:FtsW/RodA/SpoVE family cell cycle protein [Chloroflexota bacterium]